MTYRTSLWSLVVAGALVAWLGIGSAEARIGTFPAAEQCTNDDHGNSEEDATVLAASTFQTIPPTLQPGNRPYDRLRSRFDGGSGSVPYSATGFIEEGCTTDVDFFRFDLSGASSFEVFISAAGVGYRGKPAGVTWIYVEPTILDANGSAIASDHERRHGGTSFFYKRRLTPGTYYIAVRLTGDVEDRAFWGSHGWYPVAMAVNRIEPVAVVVERDEPETPNEPGTQNEPGTPTTSDGSGGTGENPRSEPETPNRPSTLNEPAPPTQPGVSNEPGEPATPDESDEPETSPRRAEKVATLMNLSPQQAYVHLYCALERSESADDDETSPTCNVFFLCGQIADRDPVLWEVAVDPKTIFSYWPGKTDSNAVPDDFEAALVAAGLTAKEALIRTSCEVFIETGSVSSVSQDCRDLSVRAYTRFGGELMPVANQHCTESPRNAFFQ